MKARVSPVQSIEPHRILAPTRDSNPGPPGPESRVVTTILPLHTISEYRLMVCHNTLVTTLVYFYVHEIIAYMYNLIWKKMAIKMAEETKNQCLITLLSEYVELTLL